MLKKNKLEILKWILIATFILFLVGNIVLAFNGMVSILFFSVIISFAFLLIELLFMLIAINKKTRINIRILLVSFFAGILLGELVLRKSGKYDSYSEQNGNLFYHTVYGNPPSDKEELLKFFNKKFIDLNPDIDLGYDSNSIEVFKILGIGDSFTEGVGAPNDSTWLKILEANLNKRKNFNQTKIINAGISGNDPFFEYCLFKEKFLAFQPDLLIVSINSSDISETIIRGGMERFNPDYTISYRNGPWYEIIFGMSYLCRLFVFEALNYDWLFLTKEERALEERVAIHKIYLCLLEIGSLAKENKIECLFVFHPLIEEVVSGLNKFDNMIRLLSVKNKLQVLNMLLYYQNGVGMTSENVLDYYWKYDKHHNANGYKEFSNGVEIKIAEILN